MLFFSKNHQNIFNTFLTPNHNICNHNDLHPCPLPSHNFWLSPGGSDGKVSACNAVDQGLIPGQGRPPGEGNGNPLQYSCLENSMDGEASWATVHEVAKSRTRMSDFTSLHCNIELQWLLMIILAFSNILLFSHKLCC